MAIYVILLVEINHPVTIQSEVSLLWYTIKILKMFLGKQPKNLFLLSKIKNIRIIFYLDNW